MKLVHVVHNFPPEFEGGTELYLAGLVRLQKESGVNVSVVAWALLHDVGLEEFDANLNSVGLVTASGRPKPAFADFKKLHASTHP